MIYSQKIKDSNLGNQSAYIYQFDSTSELAIAIDEKADMKKKTIAYMDQHNLGWLNNETYDTAIDRGIFGDDSKSAEASDMMDKLRLEGWQCPRTEYVPSIAGQFPSIPDFLSNRPDSMRKKMSLMTDRSPVKVYVNLTSSAGVDSQHLSARGVAVIAFVMALIELRPVELYALVAVDANAQRSNLAAAIIRIPTAPLDMSVACHALTSTGFARGLGYSFLWVRHGNMDSYGNTDCGHWPFGVYPGESKEEAAREEKYMRHALGMTANDIYIPPSDLDDEVVKTPLKWMQRELAKFQAQEDSE